MGEVSFDYFFAISIESLIPLGSARSRAVIIAKMRAIIKGFVRFCCLWGNNNECQSLNRWILLIFSHQVTTTHQHMRMQTTARTHTYIHEHAHPHTQAQMCIHHTNAIPRVLASFNWIAYNKCEATLRSDRAEPWRGQARRACTKAHDTAYTLTAGNDSSSSWENAKNMRTYQQKSESGCVSGVQLSFVVFNWLFFAQCASVCECVRVSACVWVQACVRTRIIRRFLVLKVVDIR